MAAISGVIRDASNNPVRRLVRVYNRDNGVLSGETYSDATTGAYSFTVSSEDHFAVAHDIEGDPAFSKVVLASHFNGVDNSTTFTDVVGHSFVSEGSPKISTSVYKFGGSSLYLDGSSSIYVTPTGSEFNFGTGDLTIEFFLNMPSTGQTNAPFVCLYDGTNQFVVYNAYGNSGTDLGLRNSLASTIVAGYVLAANTNQHIAICRFRGVTTLFVGGSPKGSFADSSNWNATHIYIGKAPGYTNVRPISYIDDLRITKGVARYTGVFTPPTIAFQESAGFGIENAQILDKLTPV